MNWLSGQQDGLVVVAGPFQWTRMDGQRPKVFCHICHAQASGFSNFPHKGHLLCNLASMGLQAVPLVSPPPGNGLGKKRCICICCHPALRAWGKRLV